jgi:hypothetical protein
MYYSRLKVVLLTKMIDHIEDIVHGGHVGICERKLLYEVVWEICFMSA